MVSLVILCNNNDNNTIKVFYYFLLLLSLYEMFLPVLFLSVQFFVMDHEPSITYYSEFSSVFCFVLLLLFVFSFFWGGGGGGENFELKD